LIALFPVIKEESIATLLPLPKENSHPYMVFATSNGHIRKNALSDFLDIRSNGKIAMKLGAGESLVSVRLADDEHDVLLSSHKGKSIRFAVQSLRQFSGRSSIGVRGINLKLEDHVVAMNIIRSNAHGLDEIDAYRNKKYKDAETSTTHQESDLSKEQFQEIAVHEEFLLSISEGGFGKRTSSYAYRCTHRGGQGVATMDITSRTGPVVNVIPVHPDDHILLLTDKGQLLRCPVSGIRISGRKTKGVKLFRLQNDERVASIAILPPEQDEPLDEKEDNESKTDS